MAAQPWAANKAFNGVFGWYTGPALRLVGEDLGRLRVLAALVLMLAALILARSVRLSAESLAGEGWPQWLKAVWPPGVVSAALCYYTVFVRTPSYNWFAAVGLILLVAGLVRTVAVPALSSRGALLAGSLLALGSFVAAIGKMTTALGATLIAIVTCALQLHGASAATRRQLAQVACWSVAVGLILTLGHILLVNDASLTLATFRRVSLMLPLVDPKDYAPVHVADRVGVGLLDVLLERPRWFLPFVALPLLLAPRSAPALRYRGKWLAASFAIAVAGTTIVVLLAYRGGVAGLAMSTPPMVVAAEAGVLVAGVTVLWARRALGGDGVSAFRPSTALMLSVALLGVAVSYPLGTNMEYASQLPGGFPVLLAAAAIGVSCVPDGGRLPALAVLAGTAVVLGAVLVPTTRAVAPFRIAPLDQQTIPRSIVPGTPPILVEPEAARWIDNLREDAQRAGFRPGSPVLDLTWHPASVLILDGRAPAVLLPAFPGWPSPGKSAAFAVSQEDPARWRNAWLLVPTGQDPAIADAATRIVGKRFPVDYQRVGTVVAPFDHQEQGLWKPRVVKE